MAGLRSLTVILSLVCVDICLASESSWIASVNPTTFSNTTLIHLLDAGGYAILSSDRPPDFDKPCGNLSADLVNLYLFSPILGVYDGAKENSFFVVLHNVRPHEERSFFYQLGMKYDQDSIIYVPQSVPVRQQLIYTTGALNGTYVEGEGYRILSNDTTDNFSSVPLCPDNKLMFTLNFDFEQMMTPSHRRIRTQILLRHHAENRRKNHL